MLVFGGVIIPTAAHGSENMEYLESNCQILLDGEEKHRLSLVQLGVFSYLYTGFFSLQKVVSGCQSSSPSTVSTFPTKKMRLSW